MNPKEPDPNNPMDGTAHRIQYDRLDERKRAEKRVSFQAQLLDAVGQAVIATDSQGKVIYWNRGAEDLYGWSQQEAIGRSIVELTPSEELIERAEEVMGDLMAGKSWTGEFTVRRRDGTSFPALVTDTPVLDEAGNVAAIIGVSTDITDIKDTDELRRSEERFRLLVEGVKDYAIFMLDPEGHISSWNAGAQRINGYTSEEILGRHFSLFHTSEDVERGHPEEELRIAKERGSFEEEGLRVRKDGERFWASVLVTALFDEEGNLRGFSKVVRDITERKEAEGVLRESEERLRRLADAAFEGILISEKGVILEINHALTEMLGYGLAEMVGRSALEFIAPQHHDLVRQKIASGNEEPYEITGVRKDGTLLDLEVRGRAYSYQGRMVRVTAVRDITERKKAEKLLEHQAFHDALTDLPNRQLLLDRLGHALRRTRRRWGRRVAVLLMDLDNFKSINDSFGHETGDLLLVVVAERLKRCLRPEDTLARFGGDEFVVLLEDATGPDEAVWVKERITEAFKRPFVVEGRQLYVSASTGIALGEDRAESPEELLRKADTAMYEAKSEAGAFGHRVFDPDMHKQVLNRLRLETDLRRAIEQGEFYLLYQPKVRLGREDTIAEVEALLRWEHPQRGPLLPEEFISLAEETGLIVPLGRWILKEACRQVKEWQDRYPMLPPLVACVNVSAGQLLYPDLRHNVGAALKECGIEARSLVLEITESALVKDINANMTILKELRELGVRFAVDDFGSEYSSLSYLMRLPVDFVKIDKTFVGGLGEDPKVAVIVEAIISLVHSLGLEAVGEGVESAEQLMYLRSMGCDLAQGFYLSGAMPSEEVDRLLADQLIP